MNVDQVLSELQFKAVRSSGPGGQHVNKTATKVEVSFNVLKSEALTEAEKELLQKRLVNRINSEGALILQCGDTRSQLRNKRKVIERIIHLLTTHLQKPKTRKRTKPSKKAIQKRLDDKKRNAQRKANRKPPKI